MHQATRISEIAMVVSVGSAALSAYFAYTTSPLYQGTRPKISFHTASNNHGQAADGQFDCETVLVIENEGEYPARGVVARINPLVPSCTIEASHEVEIVPLTDGMRLVKLAAIPVAGRTTISVRARLPKDEKAANKAGYEVWLDAPRVLDVGHEYGPARRDHQKCSGNVGPYGPGSPIGPNWILLD